VTSRDNTSEEVPVRTGGREGKQLSIPRLGDEPKRDGPGRGMNRARDGPRVGSVGEQTPTWSFKGGGGGSDCLSVSLYSLLQMECHFFFLKSQSMINFSRSLLPFH